MRLFAARASSLMLTAALYRCCCCWWSCCVYSRLMTLALSWLLVYVTTDLQVMYLLLLLLLFVCDGSVRFSTIWILILRKKWETVIEMCIDPRDRHLPFANRTWVAIIRWGCQFSICSCSRLWWWDLIWSEYRVRDCSFLTRMKKKMWKSFRKLKIVPIIF